MQHAQAIIGIPADLKQIGMPPHQHPFHAVGDKYVQAVLRGANGLPWLIPAIGADLDVERLLDSLDGLLFTGAYSNVAPHHYGRDLHAPAFAAHLDPARDATTLPLMRRAIEAGVPVLGICRGFQEMNVVYGGTLHQAVHDVAPHLDHREDKSQSLEQQYADAHPVQLRDGGLLHGITGVRDMRVNSLHGQGIERLGAGLAVEATAPDGLVEAVSVIGAPAFALAVQWHPEWRVEENPVSMALFGAFGNACRARALQRATACASPRTVIRDKIP